MNKFSKNVFYIFIILNSFFLASNVSADQKECEEKPSVFIISPQDGFVSESNSVKVLFGSKNVEINPAGKGEIAN
ncbi:hypothetical protein N9I96_02570, partial [Gammaproteobacteria bacterium]|nr:hypothetical protein [Gammaproteobacteria bacterium]